MFEVVVDQQPKRCSSQKLVLLQRGGEGEEGSGLLEAGWPQAHAKKHKSV